LGLLVAAVLVIPFFKPALLALWGMARLPVNEGLADPSRAQILAFVVAAGAGFLGRAGIGVLERSF
jgi:hypothetical protein